MTGFSRWRSVALGAMVAAVMVVGAIVAHSVLGL